MLAWWANLLGAIASGLIIAGALVGTVAGIVRITRWWKKR